MTNGCLRIFAAVPVALLLVFLFGHWLPGDGPLVQICQASAGKDSPEEYRMGGSDAEDFGDEEGEESEDFGDGAGEALDLEGFGDEEEEVDDSFDSASDINVNQILHALESRSAFTFGGFVKEAMAYGFTYDDPEWAKLKSSVNLTFDYEISETWKSKLNVNGFYDYVYQYRGRDKFSDETLEAYESEFEIRDFYWDGSFSNQTYVKFGRQIVAWGVSNSSQINDMVNPRYQRELGMVDLEDARLPVAASKFTKVFDSFDVSLVAVHEIRGHKMAVEGSEFDPFISMRGGFITIEEQQVPDSDIENTEFAIRFSKLFNGGDVAFFYSNCYDDTPYLDFTEATKSGSQGRLVLTPKHKRIWSVGFSGNMVSGSWLYKAELAKKYNLAQGRNDISMQLKELSEGRYDEDSEAIQTWREKNEVQLMISVEYSGISDLKITIEGVENRIEEYEKILSSKETSLMLYMMLDYSTWNDALKAKLMTVYLPDDDSLVLRGSVEYDFIDALTGSLGAIFYEAEGEDARLYAYRKNDKVFASIKYSF